MSRSKPWLVRKPRGARAVHVYPQGDLRRHVLCGPCWCQPRVDLEDARPLVIHNSADGRELVERHGLQ